MKRKAKKKKKERKKEIILKDLYVKNIAQIHVRLPSDFTACLGEHKIWKFVFFNDRFTWQFYSKELSDRNTVHEDT